ncbi:MAG: phosphoenolpyruvate synthase, partial [bacterium]|nr:phosphoenolpyruvate synthase [bacterium]
MKYIAWFKDLGIKDVPLVGGKNASLGEMIRELTPKGVKVPNGFAVTAEAYRYFLEKSSIPGKKGNLREFIKQNLTGLNIKDLRDLARRGKLVRETIKKAELPEDLKKEIGEAYHQMEKDYGKNADMAVRSSATAEDLPDASFAGQQDTYLNVRGEKDLLVAVRACFASLFTNRAISYRVDKKFDHFQAALSVGVQKMVRSDSACSGVMFTVDTESGFREAIVIDGVWGLGEMIVQGEVTPDEFLVYKPFLDDLKLKPIINKKLAFKDRKMIYANSGQKKTKVVLTSPKEKNTFVLDDSEIMTLARWGKIIEDHYSAKRNKWMPMDMEWAKDGQTGELFIVQARPETVQSNRDFSKIKEYIRLEEKTPILKGISVGSKIAVGKARVILDAKDITKFKAGEVLVTDMTDPDWEPIMKIAAAIVTDKGGRTSHAAIVSRELGIPCIVGSENATKRIKTGQMITVDTTGSDGVVFAGELKFETRDYDLKNLPKPSVKIMINLATPETAFEKSFLPNDGVGLAREEFIIAGAIGIHPNALINFSKIKDQKLKKAIEAKTIGYANKKQFYVDQLAYGIARIGAAFYPKPVIVRFSDFKTNEYRSLLGGTAYEPQEENPMIGWRGASRYYHPDFAAAFALECAAIKKVREEMGLTNVVVMVPFCRTPEEGKKVIAEMEKNGLKRNVTLRQTQ